MEFNGYAWAAVLLFILLDLITGWIKAFYQGNFSSTIAREGLFHKAGYLAVMLVAQLVCMFEGQIDLGVISSQLTTTIVAAWICLTEVASIIENASAISPDIANSPFGQLFADNKGSEESTDDESN